MTLTLFGLFIGVALLSACLGLLVTALCVAAKRADEQADALSLAAWCWTRSTDRERPD